jgi:uncharacterized protein (DUF169 family)
MITEEIFMAPTALDLTPFNKLDLDFPPVAVKFLFSKPAGIDELEPGKTLAFCEMLKEAQMSDRPFWIGRQTPQVCVGRSLLGMEDVSPLAESGEMGFKLGMFEAPRANYLVGRQLPKFSIGVVNYVAFSGIGDLAFDPDVLIIAATTRQSETVMRAMTYSTGQMYVSRTTPIAGCAWLYVYPYQSGEINYVIPDMIHGMRGREIFPPSTVLISIPFQWLGTIATNLTNMPHQLRSHGGRKEYLTEIDEVMSHLAEKSGE